MSAFDERPAPSNVRAARHKVFELAFLATGSLPKKERDEWRAWLKVVQERRAKPYKPLPAKEEKESPSPVAARAAFIRAMDASTATLHKYICSICHGKGHNKRKCPQRGGN